MVPESVGALLAFLLFVAPGILFELRRARRLPEREQTAFFEISRVALASVVLSGASICILVLVRMLWPLLMPDPSAWFALGTKEYLAQNHGVVARALLLELAIAGLLAFVADRALTRRTDGAMRDQPGWFAMFREWAPKGCVVHASVTMKDGTIYAGRVTGYSTHRDLARRELALGQPAFVRGSGGEEVRRVHPHLQRIWLPGDEVAAVFVEYRQDTTSAVPR